MKPKNKNLTVTLHTETEKYVENLQNEHMLNMSALFRKMVKDEYIKRNGSTDV